MADANETDIYLYRYLCRRWWGDVHDVKYLQVARNADVDHEVMRDAQETSGSKTCDVALLQHFQVCFKSAETYAPAAMFPVASERQYTRGAERSWWAL